MRIEFEQDEIGEEKMRRTVQFGEITARDLLTESSGMFLSNIFLSEEMEKICP